MELSREKVKAWLGATGRRFWVIDLAALTDAFPEWPYDATLFQRFVAWYEEHRRSRSLGWQDGRPVPHPFDEGLPARAVATSELSGAELREALWQLLQDYRSAYLRELCLDAESAGRKAGMTPGAALRTAAAAEARLAQGATTKALEVLRELQVRAAKEGAPANKGA